MPEPLEQLRVMGLEPDADKRLDPVDDALVLLDEWPGYRKATRLLARLYRRYVGPPRSGLTRLIRAAEAAAAAEGRTRSAAMAQSAHAPSEDSAGMTVKVAPMTPHEGDEPDAMEEEEEDVSWNRRWWRDDDDEEEEEESLESCATQRFLPPQEAAEADAPRILRRPHRRPVDSLLDVGPDASGPEAEG